ncbi:XrtA/PEP-CTERM system amidotransferase [Lacipirellula limnantheis]|uniref:asparagine synthase (glutamine-hydrolyzing) n=1 Tax=Lacipirellula limnantheis TaxID=2528024 RepID=A0A517TY94_9BACT|nr:XrtA/PEP-CTERM system amidotransferase [Lacipirellula limnantheis]QDT73347.1 Asparagine synthetase [glutamine-hydrolyzing] 1 [Lacipirellula limnantheis]
MCGIAGIFNISGMPIDQRILCAMSDALVHRGPDDSGYHIDNGLGLAHRRLAIIDLAAGKQPIYNEFGTVCVVFNGEIYNFHKLRAELEGYGHRFSTSTDTEVIVHSWEQWGDECVQRFRGMFAFALWDSKSETLFLARDRLGIKPLYYGWLSPDVFAFASELKSLRKHPHFRSDISWPAVEDYFAYGFVPDPHSIYSQVRKLPPAHHLRISKSRADSQPVKYWDAQFGTCSAELNVASIAEELVDRLREAVSSHLVSDVPLGAFLSGGVDSSAVVALMAELHDAKPTTCSISFGTPEFNEAQYAEEVANRYKTIHHVRQVEPEDLSLLDRLASIFDEPFADSSAIPTFRLCEITRQWVTVALSGDGGDENFAGYRDHRLHRNKQRLRALMPKSFRRALFGNLARIYPPLYQAPSYLRARTTFQTLALDEVESFARGRMIASPEVRSQLFTTSFKSELQGYDATEVMRRHAIDAPVRDPLSLAQYLDMKVYLPSDILTKVDRTSMANSLEVRVPLLDHEFVEWTAQLPSHLKLRNGVPKFILKKAFESRLSNTTLYRPKKGFSIPLANWLRGPLKQRLLDCVDSPHILESRIFNHGSLKRFTTEHINGYRDHGPLLWALMMFDGFLRAHNS